MDQDIEQNIDEKTLKRSVLLLEQVLHRNFYDPGQECQGRNKKLKIQLL
jgi:hypothetical protein